MAYIVDPPLLAEGEARNRRCPFHLLRCCDPATRLTGAASPAPHHGAGTGSGQAQQWH
jgi:hypothetical protein